MFIIRLERIKENKGLFKQVSEIFIIEEFDVNLKYISFHTHGPSIDDNWFCEHRLGGYSVDKYRVTLKQKFNALRYKNNGKGPDFYHKGTIKPMIFESREDAEGALEWVQSIQLSSKLIT